MPRSMLLKAHLGASVVLLGAVLACGDGSGETPKPVVHAVPVIASFTPDTGPAGTPVTIAGTHLTGATSLSFGGVLATSWSVTDDYHIAGNVPADAVTGSITVITPGGTCTSGAAYTVTVFTPSISDFSPRQGSVGTAVVVTGDHFTGTSAVKFGGTPVTTWTLDSDTQITATVPAGAGTGVLTVLTAGGTAQSSGVFTVSGAVTDLVLDAATINQSVQTYGGDVPLVANRDGLLRVFVRANQANTLRPVVRVTIDGGTPVDLPAPSGVTAASGVPTNIDEGDDTLSWDLKVLGSAIHSGMTLQVEVDPSHTLTEATRTNNGLSLSPSVQAASVFRITMVQVIQNNLAGNVDSGRSLSDWVDRFQRMYPIQNLPGGIDVVKRATPFTFLVGNTQGVLQASGTNWTECLAALELARVADGTSRYYYGVVNVDYSSANDSGVAGLGYVGNGGGAYKSAIGWDKAVPSTGSYSDGGHFPEVFAHEVGHNLGRNHAPCGVSSSDSSWPNYGAHANALIGVWGWDNGYTHASPDPRVASPDASTPFRNPVDHIGYSKGPYKDVMSYCSPNWISDYTYQGVLAYRAQNSAFDEVTASISAAPAARQECLMIAGRVKDGQVILDPAFKVLTVPQPPQAGSYNLQLLDATGKLLLEQSFAAAEVADLPGGSEQHFAFTLPLAGSVEKGLAGIRVLDQGQVRAMRRSPSTVSSGPAAMVSVRSPVAMRMGPGKSHVSWDSAAHPRVMVRDPRSGEVIAFAEGGYLDLPTDAPELEVTFSDGVRSQRQVLKVQE